MPAALAKWPRRPRSRRRYLYICIEIPVGALQIGPLEQSEHAPDKEGIGSRWRRTDGSGNLDRLREPITRLAPRPANNLGRGKMGQFRRGSGGVA